MVISKEQRAKFAELAEMRMACNGKLGAVVEAKSQAEQIEKQRGYRMPTRAGLYEQPDISVEERLEAINKARALAAKIEQKKFAKKARKCEFQNISIS